MTRCGCSRTSRWWIVLSHGRLEIGVGKGITPFEHLQFGHEPDEASARAADILAMLVRAWETGIMSSEGSAFYDFVELKLPWTLQQKPHPPLWTAGNLEAAGSSGSQLRCSVHDHRGGSRPLRRAAGSQSLGTGSPQPARC